MMKEDTLYLYSSNNHNDCNFTEHERDRVLITLSSTATVSFVMCVVTISLVLYLRLHKHFTYRLASYQVLSGMFVSLTMIIQIVAIKHRYWKSSSICPLFGFALEYFMWVKLLFTVCLVFHFFVLAMYLKNLYKLEMVYVLTSILLPLLFVWIPFINRRYGDAGAWCWIVDWKNNCATRNDHYGIIEQFLLWYGPLFISLTVSIIMASFTFVVLKRRAYSRKNIMEQSETGPLLYSTIQGETRHNQAALKQLLPLLAYPIIFNVLAIIPLINRIYDAFASDVSYILALAHSISIGSWGFFSSWALLIHIFIKRKQKHSSATGHIGHYSNPSTFQTDIYEDGTINGELNSSVKAD